MANTVAKSISANLSELRAEKQEMMMSTNTNQPNASDTLARIADYVGYLFEDVSDQEIEALHFECTEPASRGLNRPYDLSELMSRTIAP